MPPEAMASLSVRAVETSPVAEAAEEFLDEVRRLRAERAWAWFAVYNPLNMFVTVPPEWEEECSQETIEAASRQEVQWMFLWSLGLAGRAEALPLCEVSTCRM
jgi:hypothetical protein